MGDSRLKIRKKAGESWSSKCISASTRLNDKVKLP